MQRRKLVKCATILAAVALGQSAGFTATKHKVKVPAARAPRAAPVPIGRSIQAFTGARTRIVWVQDVGSGGDAYAHGKRLRLMGLDSKDGQGRMILPAVSNYNKPLLTPRGDRVVFSNRLSNRVFVVNWNGTGLRQVTDGFAADVWRDPDSGVEWVYVAKNLKRGGRLQNSPMRAYRSIRRYQLNNPRVSELVWDKTPVSVDSFQLSADGTRASGMFSWPDAGVAELPNHSWQKLGTGCWTSMAPDNSYRFWHFDGPHRNLCMFAPDSGYGWLRVTKVNVNSAPGMKGREGYHARWSNHVRVMTMSGPYRSYHDRRSGAGRRAEIYLGRFDAAFSRVEQWLQVTHNNRGDFYPDVWVEAGDGPPTLDGVVILNPPDPPAPVASPLQNTAVWPGNQNGLVFLWEDGAKTNEIIGSDGTPGATCRALPRGLAKYGRYREMDLAGGAFVAEDADARLLTALKQSQQLSIEALITPNHLEQQSASIITFASSEGSCNFTLAQEGDKLVLRLRTSSTGENGTEPPVELCRLSGTRPHHVVVTYAPGSLACYLDGEPVPATPSVSGDFSNWSPQHLTFGDDWDGGHNWAGRLEGITIHNRVIGAAEAKRRYALYTRRLQERRPAPQLVVGAKLLRTTPAPTPQAIAPYRRALVVYEYQVDEVLAGSYAQKRLLVAHWAILDARVLPANRKIGQSYRLTLEPFKDHPQLESERLVQESDEFDLELFYDVGQ